MGILRTILAIAVVVFHSYKIFGLRMCGGQVAVEIFYMISGFYMALILNEKYIGVGSYRKFIFSRFLRIFPIYWIILILAVILSFSGYTWFNHPYYLFRYVNHNSCLSGLTIFYFVFENIIVIGQDILYFMKIDEYCHPILVQDVLSYKHTGYQYLFVPQAWTISLEFMFYLIAPFLVTKKIKWQLVILFLGLALKYYFFNFRYLYYDPWTYRFFPFEIAFFMAGSVAYVFYKYLENKTISKYVGISFLLGVVYCVCFYEFITINIQFKNNVIYLFTFIALAFIFHAFKENKLDRYIGEFSFSLYISHHLMVSVFRGYFFSHPNYLFFYGYAVLISSLILAFMLQITIIRMIEAKRLKIFS